MTQLLDIKINDILNIIYQHQNDIGEFKDVLVNYYELLDEQINQLNELKSKSKKLIVKNDHKRTS